MQPPHKSIDAELDDILFGKMIDVDIDVSEHPEEPEQLELIAEDE